MRRIHELDALRGIAAIAIVVFHMRFLDASPAMGSAVDLFFVLSGYLITTIILEQGRSSGFFWTFYARRSLRIWPIYYLALFACVAVNPLLVKREPLDGFWYYATYLQYVPGYWHAETPAFSRLFLHTWTLAIEEQFYLLWPLVVVVLGRKRLLWGIVPLVIAPIALRAYGFHRHMLFTRCDSLALGALLSLLFLDRDWTEERRSSARRAFVAIGVLALVARQVVGPMLTRFDPVPGGAWAVWMFAMATAELNILYFAVVGIVLLDHGHRRLRWLRSPALVHAGTISYGIYLYHPFVLIFAPIIQRAIGLKGSPWLDVAKLALCVGLAEISWRLVERPLLRFKDRFPYHREPNPLLKGPHSATPLKANEAQAESSHSQ